MAFTITFSAAGGQTLKASIQRQSDGLLYDVADSTFKTTPTTLLQTVPEGTGSFIGRYRLQITPTLVAQWTDGTYIVGIHDNAQANLVVQLLAGTMKNGDEAPYFPVDFNGTIVETGINARQALALILAAEAAQLSGAGTGTITIKAAGTPATTRIVASTDTIGNRTALTLTPPA